jgi:hypothetical protein
MKFGTHVSNNIIAMTKAIPHHMHTLQKQVRCLYSFLLVTVAAIVK